MDIAFDCHVHTPRSACCEDITDEWLCQRAHQGDGCFAVTDHTMHLYYEPEIAWSLSRDNAVELFEERRESGRQRILDYLQTMRACDSPRMLVGLELDVLPDDQLMIPEDVRPRLDILLGAIHHLPTIKREAPAAEIIAEHQAKTERLLAYGVDVLAHPFRIILASAKLPVKQGLIEWVVELAERYDTALEVNSHNPFPEQDLAMIRLCRERGVRLAVGTDAHRRAEFGDFSYHRKLFRRAGLTEAELQALLFCPAQCRAG